MGSGTGLGDIAQQLAATDASVAAVETGRSVRIANDEPAGVE